MEGSLGGWKPGSESNFRGDRDGGRGGDNYRGRGNRGGGYRGRGNRDGGSRGGGDGGQGSNPRRSGPINSEDIKIGYRRLEQKTNSNPRDSIMFSVCPAFSKLLAGEQEVDEKPKWIDMMLTIIRKAFEVDQSMREYKDQLVAELMKERQVDFLNKICVERFTEALHDTGSQNIDMLIKSLDNYLDIYYEVCTLDPFANKKLVKPLRTLTMILKLKAYQEGVQQLERICKKFADAVELTDKKEREQKETNERADRQKKSGRMLTEEKPQDDFRQIPVHPTVRDLEITSSIRRNKKSGAFDSVNDYLDIQFRLLREDFISTLRNGIKQYRKNQSTGGGRFKSGDIKVYEGFHIIQPNFGKDGLTYTVKIDTNHKMFKRMNWDSSKRLIYGSLLCLSLDDFIKNFLFATIAERETDKLKKDGTLEVQFIPESQAVFDSMDNKYGPFTVVESTAYFESYTHILKGMQNIDQSQFPFSRYIVSCDTSTARPAYSRHLLPTYKLDGTDGEQVVLRLDDDISSQCLNGEMLGLNDSQYSAYMSALTQEFSVIQGPPGTGKTYVGLKIVKTLLDNLYSRRRGLQFNDGRGYPYTGSILTKPILVVCYTNHALDQFLEGMLPFCDADHIVRVGSRSKNEALEGCNLRGRRSRAGRSSEIHIAYRDLQARREQFLKENSQKYLQDQLSIAESDIIHHMFGGFIGHEIFAEQLHWFGDVIVQSGFRYEDAMRVWLGCESSASLNSYEEIPQTHPNVPEHAEAAGPELIDVEGEAERELQNRKLDTDSVDDEDMQFIAKIQKQQQPQAQANQAGGQSSGQVKVVDNDGFQTVMSKTALDKLRGEIRKRLCQPDRMNAEEVNHLDHLCWVQGYDITFNMEFHDRWRLYRFWLWRYKESLNAEVTRVQHAYQKLCSLSNDLRKQEDIEVLKQAKVIGMTTTGAARFQHVLQQVGAPIVIVEEAAEVLEAHITTALSKECQHLILIGDHKQLKPSPTVYELAKEYHLDLSLFERMVNNGLPVETLNIQHRMRPEVSKFMKHIYDDLSDDKSVMNRESIRGLSTPVYFFDHKNQEKAEEGIMSHSNEFEANMVVELTRYLILQDYKPSEITIITMYTGQLLVLKRKMPKDEFNGVKITSVDNFQGEENTIIILSLVRSNLEGKLGFVKIENRVCVSLSRAKHGMYVFGNFDMFCRGSDLWTRIVQDAKTAVEFGSTFNLTCVNHGKLAEVSVPQDFKTNAPAGGCKLPCGEKLSCGHFCERSCHYSDRYHEEYHCRKDCTKVLSPCGHPCPDRCFAVCPPCMLRKTAILPCGHIQDVYCYEKEADIRCKEPCVDSLDCGHPCTKSCSQPCSTRCETIVERMCSECGEIKELRCFTVRGNDRYGDIFNKCDTPCAEILTCGHPCIGNCYQCKIAHRPCEKKCGKSLPCGHVCNKTCKDCTDCGTCEPCAQQCLLTCSHATKCTQRCFSKCVFHVNDKGKKCTWGCKMHKNQCSRSCEQLCSHTPCNMSCTKKVKCRKCKVQVYECLGVCGEPCPFMCPTCDKENAKNSAKVKLGAMVNDSTLWIFLRDCFHTLPVDYMDEYVRSRFAARETILCPFQDCNRPVLNTARYGPQTRAKHTDANTLRVLATDLGSRSQLSFSRKQELREAHVMLRTSEEGQSSEADMRRFQDKFDIDLEVVEQRVRQQLQMQSSERADTNNSADAPGESGVENWEELA